MSEIGYRELRQLSVKMGGGAHRSPIALPHCFVVEKKNNAEKMWDMELSDREFVNLFHLDVTNMAGSK